MAKRNGPLGTRSAERAPVAPATWVHGGKQVPPMIPPAAWDTQHYAVSGLLLRVLAGLPADWAVLRQVEHGVVVVAASGYFLAGSLSQRRFGALFRTITAAGPRWMPERAGGSHRTRATPPELVMNAIPPWEAWFGGTLLTMPQGATAVALATCSAADRESSLNTLDTLGQLFELLPPGSAFASSPEFPLLRELEEALHPQPVRNVETIASTALKLLRRRLLFDWAGYFSIHQKLVVRCGSENSATVGAVSPLDALPSIEAVLEQRKAVTLAAGAMPERRLLGVPADVQLVALAPVQSAWGIQGVLAVGWSDPQRHPGPELELLRAAGNALRPLLTEHFAATMQSALATIAAMPSLLADPEPTAVPLSLDLGLEEVFRCAGLAVATRSRSSVELVATSSLSMARGATGLSFNQTKADLPRARWIAADRPNVGLVLADGQRPEGLLVVPVQGNAGLLFLAYSATATDLSESLAIAQQLGAQIYREVCNLQQAGKDVSLQHQLENELQEAQRLRALGEIASGVAHDFNNTLAAVVGQSELLLHQVSDPVMRRGLEIISQAATDGADTVKRIQDFTRATRDEDFITTDLNRLAADAIEVTAPRWRHQAQTRGVDIEVQHHLRAAHQVAGKPSALREVLVNIFFNAVEAMPRGGRIMVSTWDEQNYVCLAIGDNGVGMSEETRRRIFEPFYTTKGLAGSGLGMSIAYGIIRLHRGDITVESSEEHGSTITIRLPQAAAPAQLAPPQDPSSPAETGWRTLVVEDDPKLCDLLAQMLELDHHRVTRCTQGSQALRLLQAEPFDVVFTDLSMPEISGWEIVEAIKRLTPRPFIILVTGWGMRPGEAEVAAHEVDAVITKPYTLAAIRRAITILASKRQAKPNARR